MAGCTIEILKCDTFKETQIRHDLPVNDSDFGLLFHSDIHNGHYSAICRDDEMLLITEKVTPKRGYRQELDIEWERKVKAKDMGFRLEGTGVGSSTGSDIVFHNFGPLTELNFII